MALVNPRAVVGMLLSLAALAMSAATRAAGPNLEYAVKANFLYKFSPFVTWPPQSFGREETPFQICIAGADPFGAALDEAVRGQRIADRPIALRRMPRLESATGCQIVFLTGSHAQPVEQMLRALRGQAVLTVTDEQPGAGGSVIRFVLRSGRVRFVINRTAASQVGLTISSKLLDLAVAVEN